MTSEMKSIWSRLKASFFFFLIKHLLCGKYHPMLIVIIAPFIHKNVYYFIYF